MGFAVGVTQDGIRALCRVTPAGFVVAVSSGDGVVGARAACRILSSVFGLGAAVLATVVAFLCERAGDSGGDACRPGG
jgi:hypothetical protein